MALRKITIPGQNVPIQIGGAVNPDWYDKFKFLELLGPLSDQDYTALLAQIAATYSPIRRQFGGASGTTGSTYTFVLGDAGTVVPFNNASALTATIPHTSSVAWTAGDQIDLVSNGAGKPTLAGAANVLILSLNSNKSIAFPYGMGTLLYAGSGGGTDFWWLSGTLIA